MVVLNDNDMSIAPNVGAMSNYLARLISSRSYRSLRQVAKEVARRFPEAVRDRRAPGGGICARPRHRRHAVRGDGLLLCRPDRRPQSRPPAPHPAQCPRHGRPRAGADPCGDAERARATSRRRSPATSITASRNSTSTPASRRSRSPAAPSYTSVFREEPDRRGRARPGGLRDYRGHAVRHGRGCLRRALPGPRLRRGHCRAACGDLRGRAGLRGHEAFCRDLLDLPPARLRPDRPRCRDPVAAGALRHRPGGLCRRGRGDPLRRLRHRLSGLPAEFRAHGRRRRGRPGAHGRNGGRHRRRTFARCVMRAARASGSPLPERGEALEIGRGRIVREGSRAAILSYGARLHDALAAAERLDDGGHLDHGGGRPLRQAARRRPGAPAGGEPRTAAHGGGGLGRRFRSLRAAVLLPAGGFWTAG